VSGAGKLGGTIEAASRRTEERWFNSRYSSCSQVDWDEGQEKDAVASITSKETLIDRGYEFPL
jgi:hypothetical protein